MIETTVSNPLGQPPLEEAGENSAMTAESKLLSADDTAENPYAAPPPPPSRPLAYGIMTLMACIFTVTVFFGSKYAEPSYADLSHLDVLYNVCIALTLWSWRPSWVVAVTAGSVLLSFLAPEIAGAHTNKFILSVGLLVQALTGTLIWRQIVVQRRMEADQQKASRQIWERRVKEQELFQSERKARADMEEAMQRMRLQQEALKEANKKKDDAIWQQEILVQQAENSMKQAQAAANKERAANERERKTLKNLDRVKEFSAALQRAVLPIDIPEKTADERLQFGAQYYPAQRDIQIGGDFYDLHLPASEKPPCYGMVIGDVAGHGVEAAAQTALVTTTVRAYALQEEIGPAEVLARTARAIDAQLVSFVSLFYGVYNSETRLLTYANAGHEPPILLRAEKGEAPMPLNPTGAILGVGLSDFYETQVQLEVGDVLVLFTDGLTEARAINEHMLGWDGVAALAARRASSLPTASTLAMQIYQDSKDFAVDQRLTDDVAILVVRITG